ncbi:degenerin mec-4 [Caerostris extrusa]|uniref:Degenerin mec-4 n=1 Tax=Caerostris extrusa TaxID=172846 RepID=A0AAV4WKU7_CAEEX|nr:degenerin mec-4 [Caerostris extrusa]
MNRSFCDLANESENCCLNYVLDSMSRNASSCHCHLPCRSVNYNEKLSRSPLRLRKMITIHHTADKKCKPNQGNLRTNIFYSSLDRHVYSQNPKWDESKLLSYLGNELGLWLGLSLVAFCELFEKLISFYIRLIASCLYI